MKADNAVKKTYIDALNLFRSKFAVKLGDKAAGALLRSMFKDMDLDPGADNIMALVQSSFPDRSLPRGEQEYHLTMKDALLKVINSPSWRQRLQK